MASLDAMRGPATLFMGPPANIAPIEFPFRPWPELSLLRIGRNLCSRAVPVTWFPSYCMLN